MGVMFACLHTFCQAAFMNFIEVTCMILFRVNRKLLGRATQHRGHTHTHTHTHTHIHTHTHTHTKSPTLSLKTVMYLQVHRHHYLPSTPTESMLPVM